MTDVKIPDDFIPWGGGECPIDMNKHFDSLFRNGQVHEIRHFAAGSFDWKHYGSPWDIIAYKVVSP